MPDAPYVVRESHSRSIAKAVSWRMTATVDTFIISFVVTGSLKWAGSIAGFEMLTKMAIYYLHERAWSRIHWGRRVPVPVPVTADAPTDGGAISGNERP